MAGQTSKRHDDLMYPDTAAGPSRKYQSISNQRKSLDEGDLLASFDDIHSEQFTRSSAGISAPVLSSANLVDIAQFDPLHTSPRDGSNILVQPPSNPIHVQLPPRPLDITDDYVPPSRPPRRLSQVYTSFGPGSPPSVDRSGDTIIFHPHLVPGKRDSSSSAFQHNPVGSPFGARQDRQEQRDNHDTDETGGAFGQAHSKLTDTWGNTVKASSKFRSSIDGVQLDFVPDPPVTHTSPFSTAYQLSGAYLPPSGAPAFRPAASITPPLSNIESLPAEVRLQGRKPRTTVVLDEFLAESVRRHLPPRQRLSNTWSLLFSMDQHGASLSTLYREIDRATVSHRHSGNILVVCDSEGRKFGAFLNEPVSKKEGSYYGTGESFLFKVSGQQDTRVFRWTGKNQYFALCESAFVSFGGGSGAYGLILDASFLRNSSATCPTFDNEVLCSDAGEFSDRAKTFDCVGLEVWTTAPIGIIMQ